MSIFKDWNSIETIHGKLDSKNNKLISITPKIDWSGRKYTYKNKTTSFEFRLNDLVKHVQEISRDDIHNQETFNHLHKIVQEIEYLDRKGKEKLKQEKNIFKKVATLFRKLFGNIGFDRDKILRKITENFEEILKRSNRQSKNVVQEEENIRIIPVPRKQKEEVIPKKKKRELPRRSVVQEEQLASQPVVNTKAVTQEKEIPKRLPSLTKGRAKPARSKSQLAEKNINSSHAKDNTQGQSFDSGVDNGTSTKSPTPTKQVPEVVVNSTEQEPRQSQQAPVSVNASEEVGKLQATNLPQQHLASQSSSRDINPENQLSSIESVVTPILQTGHPAPVPVSSKDNNVSSNPSPASTKTPLDSQVSQDNLSKVTAQNTVSNEKNNNSTLSQTQTPAQSLASFGSSTSNFQSPQPNKTNDISFAAGSGNSVSTNGIQQTLSTQSLTKTPPTKQVPSIPLFRRKDPVPPNSPANIPLPNSNPSSPSNAITPKTLFTANSQTDQARSPIKRTTSAVELDSERSFANMKKTDVQSTITSTISTPPSKPPKPFLQTNSALSSPNLKGVSDQNNQASVNGESDKTPNKNMITSPTVSISQSSPNSTTTASRRIKTKSSVMELANSAGFAALMTRSFVPPNTSPSKIKTEDVQLIVNHPTPQKPRILNEVVQSVDDPDLSSLQTDPLNQASNQEETDKTQRKKDKQKLKSMTKDRAAPGKRKPPSKIFSKFNSAKKT